MTLPLILPSGRSTHTHAVVVRPIAAAKMTRMQLGRSPAVWPHVRHVLGGALCICRDTATGSSGLEVQRHFTIPQQRGKPRPLRSPCSSCWCSARLKHAGEHGNRQTPCIRRASKSQSYQHDTRQSRPSGVVHSVGVNEMLPGTASRSGSAGMAQGSSGPHDCQVSCQAE